MDNDPLFGAPTTGHTATNEPITGTCYGPAIVVHQPDGRSESYYKYGDTYQKPNDSKPTDASQNQS
jgi:hypothetical protein